MSISPTHLTTGVLSPFLPGTKIQYAWDSTSLGYLKTCPRLYQYIMLDGWSGKGESIHLKFGQHYHSALENYDKLRASGLDHETALRDVIRDLLVDTWIYPEPDPSSNPMTSDGSEQGRPWTVDETTKAGKYKNRHSLVRSVIYYLDDHRDDPAKVYILDGGKPAVELSFRFELEWGPKAALDQVKENDPGYLAPEEMAQPYLLCGHLDKVVDFNGVLFDMDHKTTTTTPGDYYFDSFSPNNQMTLYTLAAKVILAAPIKGVIINACQLLVDDTKFKRGFTHRTSGQLTEWTHDLRYWFAQAEHYAANDYWPMNDTSCDKFGGCKFREVCSKDPQVREVYLKSNFEKLPLEERWNPLKPR